MGRLPGPKYMPRMCMWVPLADLHGFGACDWAPSWGHPGSAPISCLRRGLEVDPKRRWQSFFAQACLERLDTSYLRMCEDSDAFEKVAGNFDCMEGV